MPPDEPGGKPKQRPSIWLIAFTAGAGVFGTGSRLRDWFDKMAESTSAAEEKTRRTTDDNRRQAELDQAREALKKATQRMMIRLLDEARREFFSVGEDAYHHKLRATLFRCATEVHPSGTRKYLTIYARSGANPESVRTWTVVDENPERCRGVAGYIWGIGATKILLPSAVWNADSTPEVQRLYAAETFLTVDEVNTLGIKACGFGGTIVEVGGEKWGVLLLDTQEKARLKNSKHHNGQLEWFANLLGRMLKEGET